MDYSENPIKCIPPTENNVLDEVQEDTNETTENVPKDLYPNDPEVCTQTEIYNMWLQTIMK